MTETLHNPFGVPLQNLSPPAGFEDDIAYRIACRDLTPILQDDVVTWSQGMPDGLLIPLRQLPVQPTHLAHSELAAMGLCHSIPADWPSIPSLYTHQKPTASQTLTHSVRVDGGETQPLTPEPSQSPFMAVLGVAVLIIVFVGLNLKGETKDPRKILNRNRLKKLTKDEI